MRDAAPTAERTLIVLERRRLVDLAWLATLGAQTCALLVGAGLDADAARAGDAAARGLACSACYVLFADACYRLASPRAIRLSIHASQLLGIGLLTHLWQSGGAAPAGLACFVPPLVVGGLVGERGLPLGGVLALAAALGTAVLGRGADPALGVAAGFAAAASLLGPVLSGQLQRLARRSRSDASLAEELDGVTGSVLRESTEPSVLVYADTFQVVHASRSFRRRMLLESGSLAGRSLFNLVHFDDRERLERQLVEPRGVVAFQHLAVGPEPIVVQLRFFHFLHAGTRYTHLAFEEVTDLHYFQTAFDGIDEALLVVGDAGDLLYSNRAAAELLGELYLGKPMRGLLRHHRMVDRTGVCDARSRERVDVGGRPFHLRVLSPLPGPGEPSCRAFWLTPFGEQEAREDRAQRDAQTGAYNRRAFDAELRRRVSEATREAGLALSLWEIEGLKQLDERHGLAAAEAVVRDTAWVLGDALHEGDALCRLDADRFAILHAGLGPAAAEIAAQRVLAELARRPGAGDGGRIEVSVGVTVCRPGESVAALVARADQALSEAVEGGGGCCVLRDPNATG